MLSPSRRSTKILKSRCSRAGRFAANMLLGASLVCLPAVSSASLLGNLFKKPKIVVETGLLDVKLDGLNLQLDANAGLLDLGLGLDITGLEVDLGLNLLGLVNLEIHGNLVKAELSISGGITAILYLEFDTVLGLNEENLGLSVQILNPNLSEIQGRLPGNFTQLVPGFPMLITLEPPAEGALSFSNLVDVEFYTKDLQYTAGTPLRLFKAPLGGNFRDVTTETSAGSYRARARCAKFSEFLIVADLRPTEQVIDIKFQDLEMLLLTYAGQISAPVFDQLDAQLTSAKAAWQAGNKPLADQRLNAWLALIDQHAGTAIPNVWRSSRDIDNVAGELSADTASLQYSLRL